MHFKGDSRKFQRCLRKVSKVFKGCFKEVLRVSQVRFWGAPRDLQDVSKTKWCFKGVSRQFQRRFKEVSRVLKGSVECISR